MLAKSLFNSAIHTVRREIVLKFDDVYELALAANTEAQNRSLEEKDSNNKRKKEHSPVSKEKVNQTKVKRFEKKAKTCMFCPDNKQNYWTHMIVSRFKK